MENNSYSRGDTKAGVSFYVQRHVIQSKKTVLILDFRDFRGLPFSHFLSSLFTSFIYDVHLRRTFKHRKAFFYVFIYKQNLYTILDIRAKFHYSIPTIPMNINLLCWTKYLTLFHRSFYS